MGHYKAAARVTSPPKIITGWLDLSLSNDYFASSSLGTFYLNPGGDPIFDPPSTSLCGVGGESPFTVIMFDDRGCLWRARHKDAVDYLRRHGFLKEGDNL